MKPHSLAAFYALARAPGDRELTAEGSVGR